MVIRRYIVLVATEDSASDKDVQDCLMHGLDALPAAYDSEINLESERKTQVDKGIDPQGTIEENEQWIRLAVKELSSRG